MTAGFQRILKVDIRMLNSGIEFAVMSVDHGARKANRSPMSAGMIPGENLTMISCGRMVPVRATAA